MPNEEAEALADQITKLALAITDAIPGTVPSGVMLGALATVLGTGINQAPASERRALVKAHVWLIGQLAHMPRVH